MAVPNKFSSKTAIAVVVANMIGTDVFTSLGFQLLGKPILMGSRAENNQAFFTQLVACGAALSVNNRLELQQTAATLLGDRMLCERMGRAGQALVANNRQALELTLKVVEQQFTKPSHS